MPSILLVDDDPNILDGLKDILEDAGYDIHLAANAADAKALLAAAHTDLVIVDYNLPDVTGPDLAAEIAAGPKPPIILLMTGMGAADIPAGPGREAIREILIKPVHPPALLALLEKALRRP